MSTRAQILVSLAALGLAGLWTVEAPDAEEKPWLDWRNCDACAPFAAETGLMDHTRMEFFPIATGLLEVAEVPAEYQAAYARASEKCNAVMGRWQKGEKVNLCGYCTSFGALSKAGARIEDIETDGGRVLVATSTDPALIGRLHTHVEKTNAEMRKMSQASAPKASGY